MQIQVHQGTPLIKEFPWNKIQLPVSDFYIVLSCVQREARPSAVVGSWAGKSRSKKGFEKGVKMSGSH